MMNTHNGITQEALEFALPLLERLGDKDGGTATEAVEKVRAAIEQIKAAADPISTQAWMLDARKQIAGIAESRTLTTVQYSFGHASAGSRACAAPAGSTGQCMTRCTTKRPKQ